MATGREGERNSLVMTLQVERMVKNNKHNAFISHAPHLFLFQNNARNIKGDMQCKWKIGMLFWKNERRGTSF